MIWLFKCNDVLLRDKLEVNEHYLFDEDDIDFDMSKYDIPLFSTASYYLLNDINPDEIYLLLNPVMNKIGWYNKKLKLSPSHLISEQRTLYKKRIDMIKSFYDRELRNLKLNELGI